MLAELSENVGDMVSLDAMLVVASGELALCFNPTEYLCGIISTGSVLLALRPNGALSGWLGVSNINFSALLCH